MSPRCDCVEVEIGSYANSVALYPPPSLGLTRVPVTVDRCIAGEVEALWSHGVVTTGNCCGHNKARGFISTKDAASRGLMLALGYAEIDGHPDHFQPKSLRAEGD